MGTWTAAGGLRIADVATAAALTLFAIAVAWFALYRPAAFDTLLLDREAFRAGQPWRLWTGHLVHLDARHAAANVVALALLASIAVRLRALWPLLGDCLLLMPVISLGLLVAAPDLQWYAGLSGLLHAWAGWLLVRRGGKLAAGGMVLLLAKLAWETTLPASVHGFAVVAEAHRVGALAGVSMAALRRAYRATAVS